LPLLIVGGVVGLCLSRSDKQWRAAGRYRWSDAMAKLGIAALVAALDLGIARLWPAAASWATFGGVGLDQSTFGFAVLLVVHPPWVGSPSRDGAGGIRYRPPKSPRRAVSPAGRTGRRAVD